MPVRAVLFDLGNTLIFQAHEPDEKKLYDAMAEHVRPVLGAWGVQQPRDLPVLLRELYDAVRAAQPSRRAQGLEVDGAFIARGALAAYGVEVSTEESEAFWRASATSFTKWGLQPYPDTLDTLRHLRSLGLSSALVCNGWYASDLLVPLLEELGITKELLDAIVSSADTMCPKPDLAPFLRALEALRVQPADAVFVGDDFEADVRGAKTLGMTTVWKLNGRHEVDRAPQADYMIHDLWELFTLDLLPSAPSAMATPHGDDNPQRYY